MNENINLCDILKDCPEGTKFYSYAHGVVHFMNVAKDSKYPIWIMSFPKDGGVNPVALTKEGYIDDYYNNESCVLVPSLEQPDWSKWKCPKPKFDPKTLNAFDRVLVSERGFTLWSVDFFSFVGNKDFKCIGGYFNNCIPYNDDTKHLLGTTDEAPEYYRYWED